MSKVRSDEIVREFRDGEIIIHEGDEGREMFIIQEGSVRVTKRTGDDEIELNLLERGDFFGEMALLESLPRSATSHAVGNVKLLVLNPGTLMLRFRRDPTFALEMVQSMSRKLRHLTDTYVSTIEEN